MKVELRCDPECSRAWIADAVRSFEAAGHHVQLSWTAAGVPSLRGLDGLLGIERLFLHAGRSTGAERIDPSDIVASTPREIADVIIDFTDAPIDDRASGARYLRPLFNGQAGERAAITAILAGDLPVIELRDELTGGIIDRGHPSAEVAVGLSGALASLMVRTVTLLKVNLGGAPRPPNHVAGSASRCEAGNAYWYVLRGLIREAARTVYRWFFYTPHWHIGWRFTDNDGVWASGDLTGKSWHRLPERPHSFVADPFPVTWQGRTAVFFEELDHRIGKGVISAVEFDDGGPVGDIRTVIEEPWHLSYPFVMEDAGELWMIPESSAARDVALYRCVRFPDQWERHATLLSDVELGDATVVRHDGKYYLFGVTREGAGGYSDTLSIYHADALCGPWLPHAQNPVMLDRANARPAGHFVRRDDRLCRPVQDCSDGYGAALALTEIKELSPTQFEQVTRQRISPSSNWPGRKLHTLNRCGRLEVIDGSRIQSKMASYLFKSNSSR